MVFLVLSCKPEKKIIKEQNQVLSAPPIGQPTFNGQVKDHVDQWKRLSIGFTCLLNDTSTCNNFNLRILINNKVASNNNDPIRNGPLYNSLLATGFPFNVPTSPNSDLYDALANRIGTFNPPTSIATWDNTFFYAFNHQWAGGTDGYFVTNTLPMREFQLTNGNLTKPALVCPDPEVFDFPMVAYGYSYAGGGSITEIQIPDNEFYFDLIESGDYAVFALQYDYINIDDSELSGNCEGGWAALDGACDGNCGENETNSPVDCGDHTKNKVLYIKKFKFNDDSLDMKAPVTANSMHWERASGNYEPMFSCWNMQTNGHFEGIQRVQFDKVNISLVKRIRKKNNGSVWSRGITQWVLASKRNVGGDLEKVIIANHYNPLLGKIYLSFFENDGMRRLTFKPGVPLLNGTNTFDYLRWRGDRGNVTAGKHKSRIWGYAPNPSPSFYYNYIPYDPLTYQWVEETMGSEQIMAYYGTYGINEMDYVIYYLKNKREW